MTKQPHSATKLRVSKLFRCLAVLCFIKFTILSFVMLDVPLPQWPDSAPTASQNPSRLEPGAQGVPTAENSAGALATADAARPADNDSSHISGQNSVPNSDQAAAQARAAQAAGGPQGADAAHLAASIKPKARTQALLEPPLPASPANHANSASPAGADRTAPSQAVFTPPALPEPALALASPPPEVQTLSDSSGQAPNQASGQAPAPLVVDASPKPRQDEGWLDMLGLNRLPVPGLGSVRAAHAAALDMPVPQAPASASPFAPAEQQAPSLPGAPAIPANIPRGQGADGAPIAPRGAAANGANPAAQYGQPALPNLPTSSGSAMTPPPAPMVTPSTPPDDPNAKTQELARQQQDILMLRRQMDQRLKDLQNAEEKVKDLIREAKSLEDKKMRGLMLMYTNMKPKVAAKALENLDERVAVRILSDMAPKQSGEILTYTNPAKTAKFTELISRMRVPQ